MSLWGKVKSFFGGGGASGGEGGGDGQGPPKDPAAIIEAAVANPPADASPATVRAVGGALLQLASTGKMFASGEFVTQDHRARLLAAKHLEAHGLLAAIGYAKTDRVYHPIGEDPKTFSPTVSQPPPRNVSNQQQVSQPSQAQSPASNQGGQSYRQAPIRVDPSLPDPYEAHDILGLSPEETRKRSLKIKPYATAWIGRVDTIPPQSDERTALIDRGLILRGMLTQDQLREIHRVGDLWLKHHESHKLAKAAAAKSVEQFLEGERQKKLAAKEEKRQAAENKRADQRKAVLARRKNDIVFLGRDVSARLADRRSNVEALSAAGLPFLATPADVAETLGLTIAELRHLAFHAEAPERTHYITFEVPKRSGGVRLLASPHKKLRAAQQFIQDELLSKLPLTEAAHGFVPSRSTVTNARLHTGQSLVINLDLKDFFPSVTFPRVRGLFESVGYSPAVATILALIVTEAPRMKTEVDGKTLWVAAGDRALPQGACTSPTISNLVARKLDRRLGGLCSKLGVSYSRYADDLTFSLPSKDKVSVGYLFARVRHIVAAEGFAINEAKGRVQRAGGRQEVTGIVVNHGLTLRREEFKRLRAVLHDAKQNGLEAANCKNHPNFREHLLGKIAYVTMVDPEKGNALRAQFDAL